MDTLFHPNILTDPSTRLSVFALCGHVMTMNVFPTDIPNGPGCKSKCQDLSDIAISNLGLWKRSKHANVYTRDY